MKRLRFKYRRFFKYFFKNELFIKVFIYAKLNTYFPNYIRQNSLLILSGKRGYTYFIRNYCLLSGKTRYHLKKPGLSRMFFKELTEKSNTTGFYKNS